MMNRSLFCAALLLLSATAFAAPKSQLSDWQDPAVVESGRLPMRSYFVTDGKYVSLNGEWDFRFFADRSKVTREGFSDRSAKGDGWKPVQVPGLWEFAGYVDPLYVNTRYPWDGHFENNPPFVPDEHNYVGQYQRVVTVDKSWKGEEIDLVIGSATSNVRVFVNGREVGYSEDSKLEARFDLSKYLREGDNLLGLELSRWCDGSYLECQDFWRFAGLSRDTYLHIRPKAHIEDVKFTASAEGEFDFKAEVTRQVDALSLELLDADGSCVFSQSLKVSGKEKSETGFPVVRLKKSVPNPRLWSAEEPNLYRLNVSALSRGKAVESTCFEVGFRTVEVKGINLLVNGRPVLIKGVNRHEMNAYKGYQVSVKDMIGDIRIIKQLNCNAVRTCHYPDDPRWYSLCDRYGLYVLDEANVETHGMGYGDKTLAKNPAFEFAHVDRVRRMVLRDYNHPSVIIWSLGNESGPGPNFVKSAAWVRSYDPTRPVHYEQMRQTPVSDINCPMYYSYADCKSYLESGWPSRDQKLAREYGWDGTPRQDKPLIQCEYAHAMGNSLGGFKEYWDLIRGYPGYQGGFIWDFVDQAVRWSGSGDKGTDRIFAYGGDFNDYDPSDGDFNCNGVIAADRSLHPQAYEVFYQHRNIHTDATPEELLSGKVKVYNENFFVGLDNVRLVWTLQCEGENVLSGVVDRLDVPAQQTVEVALPGLDKNAVEKACGPLGGKDVFLLTEYVLKSRDGLLDALWRVSYDQLPVVRAAPRAFTSGASAPRVEKADGRLVFSGVATGCGLQRQVWSAAVDTRSGLLTSYVLGGKDLLRSPVRPCFTRAFTSNDLGASNPKDKNQKYHLQMRRWADPAFEPESVETVSDAEKAVVKVVFKPILDGAARVSLEYVFDSEGNIILEESMEDAGKLAEAPLLGRFGLEFSMGGEYSTVDFYGPGPFETYADRCSSALVGRYVQRVEDQYHYGNPFPQESGTHVGLRYFKTLDDNGEGFCIARADGAAFSASALPLSRFEMDPHTSGIRHSLELKGKACENERTKGATWVNFDLVQMGLGCETSWRTLPLEAYWVKPEPRSVRFVLRPVLNQ